MGRFCAGGSDAEDYFVGPVLLNFLSPDYVISAHQEEIIPIEIDRVRETAKCTVSIEKKASPE